jgi:flagellar biosynthesis/type III secretory pathway chaperone
MKNTAAKLSSIINDLARVIGLERTAIDGRAIDSIAGLTEHKKTLLGEFDAIVAAMEEDNLPATLIGELSAVRTAAQENAVTLQAMAEGARNALQRLKSINEKALATGVYLPGGATLINPDAATFSSKA